MRRGFLWLASVGVTASLLVPHFASASLGQQAKTICPVTGGEFTASPDAPQDRVNNIVVYFCCNDCVKMFRSEPEKYLLLADKGHCPVDNNAARAEGLLRVVVNNRLRYFCSDGCARQFADKPVAFMPSLTDPVTGAAFTPKAESPHEVYRGQHYFFQSADSKKTFDRGPDRYVVVYGEKQPD